MSMKKDEIIISVELPVLPEVVFADWLDSERHTLMTGGEAQISAIVGEQFTAWDDYINGENLEIEENKRILQTWRTSEFEDHYEDSQLEITFTKMADGTRLTLNHTNLEPGDGEKYSNGWQMHYFEPMKEFYGS